ncbi:1,4-dihydroxy-2-naphthoate octaprenyltransferase [Psychromonas sp. Urea-02u-13]|uniref:1,4-dihydroxy-2-naphthoate octaprenyltransferase n=1 Tax=Psychromonas sp. Urea-02u-13 TaxID=2058326 RepID=UPI000C33E28A|nr:1,4-dihydroxy-2-naphthoate octaprenyltransferase [Psychromonas sp. Urea-02u-13]PKG40560.1 1,4-dihydroxy-2-naphthoate octaprenyltransferase [Psychromonas sp. Urea-02u-13]
MKNLPVWLSALRLRTLPLAAASIIVGAGIAVHHQVFDLSIFLLSLTTALLLQILSNLANDYGDALSGADDENRVGPIRAMQTGLITAKAMKNAIIITIALTLVSGLSLLLLALNDDLFSWLVFLGLGVLAIIAAITYTLGKLPYGYRALGDVAVFLFFGLLGVIGSFYLYALSFDWLLVLPASSIGLLSAAVLNINNIRDIENDRKHNKTTLVVLLGRAAAFKYHLCLISLAPLLAGYYLFNLESTQTWQYLFLLAMSPLIKSCNALNSAIHENPSSGDQFNEQLKNTAIGTFVFAMLFALVLIT